jgi:hypothetical protein
MLETEQNILNKKKKIAKVILEQLGGSRFEAMTGLRRRSFIVGEGKVSGGIILMFADGFVVTIQLNCQDLYDMSYYKTTRDFFANKISGEKEEDLFCSMLREVFAKLTGYDVHL